MRTRKEDNNNCDADEDGKDGGEEKRCTAATIQHDGYNLLHCSTCFSSHGTDKCVSIYIHKHLQKYASRLFTSSTNFTTFIIYRYTQKNSPPQETIPTVPLFMRNKNLLLNHVVRLLLVLSILQISYITIYT